jgi:hypothetical protein
MASLNCGSVPYWKLEVRSHIEEMEKLIVLAVLIAIVVFVATYALSALREHRH